MRYWSLLLLVISFSLSCSKPKATVFKDLSLLQEEMATFCLVGDLGRDTPHQKAIADALDRERCNRIIFLGDLIYPKGISSVDDPELENRFLSYYQPLLDKDPKLVINLVLGNHDHKKDPSAWKDVSKRHEGFFFPYYYYMIDYGGLCLVAIDTSFYYYTEKISESFEQNAWMLSLEPRLKDCDVKVAVTHHPLKGDSYPGSVDWNGADGNLKAFLETFIIGKFDLHVAGHVHVLADDGKDEGTRLLISGTGGEVLSGRPGFVVLHWSASNPKRIGYNLRYVDTEVNVYNEGETSQAQQAPYSEEGSEEVNKSRVEPSWWERLVKVFKG